MQFFLLFYKLYMVQWRDKFISILYYREPREKHVSAGNQTRFACVADEHSSKELFGTSQSLNVCLVTHAASLSGGFHSKLCSRHLKLKFQNVKVIVGLGLHTVAN
jgi:hypothetical protein